MVTTGLSGVLCPGLGLKAWALINGSAGTIIKQSNVASVVRNTAGQWTITLTSPMASVNYVGDVTPKVTNGFFNVSGVSTFVVGTNSADIPFYVAVYE